MVKVSSVRTSRSRSPPRRRGRYYERGHERTRERRRSRSRSRGDHGYGHIPTLESARIAHVKAEQCSLCDGGVHRVLDCPLVASLRERECRQ